MICTRTDRVHGPVRCWNSAVWPAACGVSQPINQMLWSMLMRSHCSPPSIPVYPSPRLLGHRAHQTLRLDGARTRMGSPSTLPRHFPSHHETQLPLDVNLSTQSTCIFRHMVRLAHRLRPLGFADTICDYGFLSRGIHEDLLCT